jgi:hypothetical protein
MRRRMYPVTMTIGLDRRRVWKDARRAEGRCPHCGRRIDFALSSQFCPTCLLMARLYARRYRKAKRWRSGGPGRPPSEITRSQRILSEKT